MHLRSNCSVTYIMHMGCDENFARAARRSTKQYDKVTGYKGLIKCLMEERHGSPFEHGGLTVEVEAPIFVAREWMRHRVPWGYSELSMRYSEADPIFWIPDEHRGIVNEGSSMRPKLGLGTHEQYETIIADCEQSYEEVWERYQGMLEIGIAREVARTILPVGIFTNFWATANPRGILHFLSLRSTMTDAQYPTYPMAEIDQAAQQLEEIFTSLWPHTYKAFIEAGRVAP